MKHASQPEADHQQPGETLPKVLSRTRQVRAVFSKIIDCLRQSGLEDGGYPNAMAAAFVLFRVSRDQKQYARADFVKGAIDGIFPETAAFAAQAIDDKCWDTLLGECAGKPSEIFAEILLASTDADFRRSRGWEELDFETPACISELALALLRPGEGDVLIDLGSGTGGFLVSAVKSGFAGPLYGCDLSKAGNAIADMRLNALGADLDRRRLDNKNFFELASESGRASLPAGNRRLVFSNYSWGGPVADSKSTSWLPPELIDSLLGENGRAVAVVPNRALGGGKREAEVRRQFIDRGLIECVIALPARLFDRTVIPVNLIVFSKGNSAVRLINAENEFETLHWKNRLSQNNIEAILSLLTSDNKNSCSLPREKIAENDDLLSPALYLNAQQQNGTPLGNIITRLSRGAPSGGGLDSMISNEPTNIQYLMTQNIQNGRIEENLPCLKDLKPTLERYCAPNHALILSKNGSPIKAAVASVAPGQKLLVSGNLYIVELDAARANPHFVKAYFESASGSAALKSVSGGSVISMLTAEALKKIKIPLPPLDEQEKFVQLYLAENARVNALRQELADAEKKLAAMFDETFEGYLDKGDGVSGGEANERRVKKGE